LNGEDDMLVSEAKGNLIARIVPPFLLIALCGPHLLLSAQEPKADVYQSLHYRYIGPQGNRVDSVAGVTNNLNLIYAGTASGGIFKTSDGGVHWEPVFDDQTVASIGALAVSRSDPNVVWAGTGESFIRGNVSIGNGIYKSTDSGKTWDHMGLDQTGRISQIVVHPTDPNIVYAAAMGHCYGPQQERGVFRTMDGGKTWERTLFVDENTGAADLVMDPHNPRVLFAGMWQVELRPWDLKSGGPSSGLYVSSDAGATWKHLTGHGLPESPLGRIGLAIAPSDSNRVYALIETDDKGVLWRSNDGGTNWTMINRDRTLNRRPHYYSRLAVMPDNPNEIYFLTQLELHISTDGGVTSTEVRAVYPDNHVMWIDPLNADRLIVANDRYVSISTNRGQSWMRAGLPNAQMYHVATDDRIPYYVYGNRQDGPAHRGPSNSLATAQILPGDWLWVGGSESGFTYPDPIDPNYVWTSGQAGYLEHLDTRTGQSRSVNPSPGGGWPIADLKYRLQWTFPVALSPHDPHKLYVGSQYVHVSTDGGQTWTVISPDLTMNDKTKQQSSGGLSPDNSSVEFYCVLFAIAESPADQDVIWAGSNDGLVHVTRDGGKNWINVTKNFPNLPPWGTVSNIEPSRYASGAAYVTIDLHQMNDRNPYVFKTVDYGSTWIPITKGIPRDLFGYAHCIREDPVRKGLLYLGTENAMYVSFDNGNDWIPLQTNLPHSPVTWMTVQERFHDLVVATYGRGFWILDDISPLEQLTQQVQASNAYLFEPRAAYRFLILENPRLPMYMGEGHDPPSTVGHNPPYGASVNYYLSSSASEDVQIQIFDSDEHLIRTLKGSKQAGINRVWWDLKYEPTKSPQLKTSPIGHPEIGLSAEGWRPFPIEGGVATGAAAGLNPLVQPGTYKITLKTGQTELTRNLTVIKDPNSTGNEDGVRRQTKLILRLRDEVNEMTEMIDQAETIRKQIADVKPSLQSDKDLKSLVDEGEQLDRKLLGVEETFFDPHITGSGDAFYYAPRLYTKLLNVARDIMESDYQPTAAQLDVSETLIQQITSQKAILDKLIGTDVPAYNDRLKGSGLIYVGLKPR
jgi:photosystem II stability/assembly factor-like uncharacterized protein